jgi:ribosome-binding factor A
MEVIHSAVGTITESDVALASASHAIILGFHTRVDSGVADKAKHEGVQIKLYAIIYELIDQVKEGMAGLLDPILKDVTVGVAEVRKVFIFKRARRRLRRVERTYRQGKVRVRARKSFTKLTQSRAGSERSQRSAGRHGMRHPIETADFLTGDAIECYSLERLRKRERIWKRIMIKIKIKIMRRFSLNHNAILILIFLTMPSLRLQRVRELLKRAIGEAIRQELPVSEAGLVTVNDVDVAGDLKSATVFISILGNADQQKRGIGLLTRNRPRIQDLMSRAVVLKFTPKLRFVLDDSVVRGNRVLEIIEELEKVTHTTTE